MIKKSINNHFDTTWNRISNETGIKSLRKLAVIIKKTQPTISAAKAKGEFPAGWAYEIEKKYGLLTGWIMTGEGPKKLEEQREIKFYEELEEWARETGQSENTQWLRNQIESFFPMFKKWKEEKEESEAREADTSTRKVA